MQPTVGRIVHYNHLARGVVPAIVTKVWNATCVDLEVFGSTRPDDRIVTSAIQGTDSSQWTWPPRS